MYKIILIACLVNLLQSRFLFKNTLNRNPRSLLIDTAYEDRREDSIYASELAEFLDNRRLTRDRVELRYTKSILNSFPFRRVMIYLVVTYHQVLR